MTKKEKCSISQKNRIVIHKGTEEKRVFKEDLAHYLNNGWKYGCSEMHKSKLSEINTGKPAWNKGKHPTEETRNKMSSADKGHKARNEGLSKADARIKQAAEKASNTKIKKYGNAFGNQNMDEAHKKHISEATTGKPHHMSPETLKIKLTKDYLTKKKNNTFNTSKPEKELYEKLLKENVNKTIYKQYKCERYPFYCDFYIVEDDKFIELNAHWTHGGRPFDPTDKECIKQLEAWKEKAKTSKFYEGAIYTWTVRDVEKAKVAKENNLNYLVIY